jgi:ABC-2 type transport system ATP-binding protein
VIIIHKGEIVADDKLSNLHQSTGKEQLVAVEFKEHVQKEWLENLTGVLTVKNIPRLADGQEYSIFNIQCSSAEVVKKEILKLVIEKNLNIISLQTTEQTLEEVFRSLTAAEKTI